MPIHPLQIQLLALPKAAVLFFMKRILPLLLLVPFLFSCRPNPTRDELRRIADIVYEEPGQALAALQALDTAKTKSRSLQADYSLFKSLALTRLFKEDTVVFDFIHPAEQYYSKKGTSQKKAQLEYCLGMSCGSRKEWPDAIIHLKKADELAEDGDDIFLKAIINSALANTFSLTDHSAEWLDYSTKTTQYAELLGKEEFIRRSHLGQAAAYSQNYHFAESDSLFQLGFSELLKDDVPPSELLFGASCAIQKRNNDPILACLLYEKALSQGAHPSDKDTYGYSYALLLRGYVDKANHIIDSLRSRPSTKETDYWNYKIARWQKDNASALDYCENYCSKSNKSLMSSINNSLFKRIAEKEKSIAALNEARAQKLSLALLLIIILALMSVILLLYHSRQRKIRHEIEMDRFETIAEEANRLLSIAENNNVFLQSENSLLKSEKESLHTRLFILQRSFCRTYQNRLSELGRLCESFTPQLERNRIKSSLINYQSDRLSELISAIISGPKKQMELEVEINANLDNIINKIRSDFPNLDNNDILFLCYMAIGFESPTIAMLCDISKNYARVKKSRFRELLFSKTSPHSELYHIVFDKSITHNDNH